MSKPKKINDKNSSDSFSRSDGWRLRVSNMEGKLPIAEQLLAKVHTRHYKLLVWFVIIISLVTSVVIIQFLGLRAIEVTSVNIGEYTAGLDHIVTI